MPGLHESLALQTLNGVEYSDTDLAWLAGFIDGEGCIRIFKDEREGRTTQYGLQVQISQKDPTVLLQFKEHWGGSVSVHHLDKNSGSSNYAVKARKAAALLEAVLPYLVIKKEQAEIALRFQARRLAKPIGPKRIDRTEDDADYWALRVAKQRYAIRDVYLREVVMPSTSSEVHHMIEDMDAEIQTLLEGAD